MRAGSVLMVVSALAGWIMAQSSSRDAKVKVAVYYESLCPDSRKFITTQLHPALTRPNSTLSDHVELTLVPFGKSSYIYDKNFKEYNFTCHHGEDECMGNRIHACALHIIADGDERAPVTQPALDFASCLMAEVDRSVTPNAFPTKRCAEKSEGVNYSKVENCAKHVDGQGYLAHYGFMTEKLRPALTSVPTITIDEAVSRDAEGDFVRAVCDALRMKGGDLPLECSATGHGVRAVTASLVLVLIASVLCIRT